jgi:hypothetical protein
MVKKYRYGLQPLIRHCLAVFPAQAGTHIPELVVMGPRFSRGRQSSKRLSRIRYNEHQRLGRAIMEAKPRLILALLMSSVMVFMVTLLVTFLDLGLRSDFLIQWVKAYFIAWPVAATTAFFIMPPARRLTDRIIALIDGRR